MNLPGSAIEFLDAFRGLYIPLYKLEGAREAVEKKGLYPLVHCYCFTKNMEDQEGDILEVSLNSLLSLTAILFCLLMMITLSASNKSNGNASDYRFNRL